MHDIESQLMDENATLATLLSGEKFWPSEPRSVHETGLSQPFIESLLIKSMLSHGKTSGRQLAKRIALPFAVVETILTRLRSQRLVTHSGSAPLNDYFYTLSEDGKREGQIAVESCNYVGPAPVPLLDYVISVEAQAISDEAIRRDQLEKAFSGISVNPQLMDLLGPAVNSASGMFLYGAPGNGKSTLAKCITSCFGQEIWIPHAIIEDDCLVKLYDPAYHNEVDQIDRSELTNSTWDARWVRVKRPTVVVGGELTLDNLEIRHDGRRNIGEAPLQMKSNCGCLLIDDFGRQRISPSELLNRWIVPLESRHDFLTLSTGKKIQVPFEQLILFSTNLDPDDLVDEAFLRRIPYKIEIGDPCTEEFEHLFAMQAEAVGCDFNPDAVRHLMDAHYALGNRPLRRCHARDIIYQVRNLCKYYDLPLTMSADNFDRVAVSFFTTCLQRGAAQAAASNPPPLSAEVLPPPVTPESAADSAADDAGEDTHSNRQEPAATSDDLVMTGSTKAVAVNAICATINDKTNDKAQAGDLDIADEPAENHTIRSQSGKRKRSRRRKSRTKPQVED